MRQLVRQRLVALLLPMLLPLLGLVLAAVWLGYSVAEQLERLAQPSNQTEASAETAQMYAEVLVAAAPALLMLVLLTAMAYLAARKVLVPWITLAQTVQARSPKDVQQLALDPEAPMEVRAMTEALNRLLLQASAERDAQQRFIADAAHQLRTPLAALQSQAEAWALMAQAAPDQHLLLSTAQAHALRNAARRTSQLANQLLMLSRVDSGAGQSAAMQRVDLQSLCEALMESFLDSALYKGLDLGLEAQPAHVTGHEWSLRELISNLLDNAIKYTPHGGHITLRCGRRERRRGDSALETCAFVEVEDNGPGVPEGEYTRLTQRFYRMPGVEVVGTGLGLAIAEEIAQVHGARLQFGPGTQHSGLKVLLMFEE